MRPFEHIDSFDIRELRRIQGVTSCPALRSATSCPALMATRFYGGSASTQANPATFTTSGAASPLVSGSGASATGSSIAVGSGGKYMESGSVDLTGADLSQNISASAGGTVNITGDSEDPVVNQLLDSLANGGSIPVSLSGGGGGTTVVSSPASASWLDNVNWTLVAIAGAVVAVVFILFRKRS